MALRTPLPADIRPGETQCVPVHVVPPSQPGRYELQLIVLHDGVGLVGSTATVALEVRDRELVAVIGRPGDVTETLAGLALPPEVEPVVVLGNDSDRSAYGDYQSVPGLRHSLLDGLEDSGRLARGVRLSSRSLSVVRSARRYRRTKVTHDVRLVGLFDVLAHSRKLVIAGIDWPADAAPGREWWRAPGDDARRSHNERACPRLGWNRPQRHRRPRHACPMVGRSPEQPDRPNRYRHNLALRLDTPLVAEPTHEEISAESGDSVAALR